MASIDERVVAMAFENAQFEARVTVTLSTLSKLDGAIKNIGQNSGLGNIETEANKVTLSGPLRAINFLKSKLHFGREAQTAFSEVESAGNKVKMSGVNRAIDQTAGHFTAITQAAARVDISTMGRGVQSVANSFSILEGAAAVALGTIASKALMAGGQLASSLSLGPVIDGFQEYSTNLNSIQTILANTQQDGTNLQQVNAALQDLNKYSDKTIYNFSQMAKNIGTFTAAGVKLKPATESIKGIANLAALSGSNSEQASSAMYQLSQAIAAGKVNLQDWNSVVNSGMGGKVFQKALFDTGKAMGTITNSPVGQTFEQWEKAGNNFRTSLSATQKAARDGTNALKTAQVESAKAVKDAHENASEAIANAAERVKDTQKAAAQAVTDAANKVKEAQQSAADETKAAADKVIAAQNGVKDAAKKATADIKAAVDAQKEQTKQSAEDVKAALEGVVEARKRLVEAMKPPSADELQAAADQLTTAQLDQADLTDAITQAQREQQRSAEDLEAAQAKLAELQKTNADPADILAATRAVEDAQTRANDATDAVTRATLRQNAAVRDLHEAETNLADVKNKGTDADQNVKDARDALTKATEAYKDAQIKQRKDIAAAELHVRDVRKQSAKDQKAAGEELAQAEKDQARVQIKAREDVAAAEREQRDTIVKSREDIAKAEKDQAKAIKDAREQEADAIEAAASRVKSARESMTGKDTGPPSWLTSDVLTKTLRQFTGDLTDAQLKAMGFTDEQIKAIQQTAKTAQQSATQVKTLGALWDTTKEQIGTGWADTFKIIFGDFGEAKTLFTTLSKNIGGFATQFANARNKLLKDWKSLGGREALIKGLSNAFEALMSVVKPIHDAFRDIFPPTTGKRLAELTKSFRDFMAQLKLSPETSENLRRTFRGLFAILDIGKTVIGEILGVFFDLIGVVGSGSGGVLAFTGSLGDLLVAIDNAITKGKGLSGVFDAIQAALEVPLKIIKVVAGYIADIFGFGDSKAGANIGEQFAAIGRGSESMRKLIENATTAWEGFKRILDRIYDFLKPFIDAIGVMLLELRQKVVDTLDFLTSEKGLNIAQTGLLAGIFAAVRKGLATINIGIPVNSIENLNKALGALTGTLTGLQAQLHAATIFTLAAAIGLLAASIVILSKVDSDKLRSALTGIAVGLGELGAAMLIMSKLATGTLKVGPMAASFILLAGAMILLAVAIRMLAKLDWVELAKGLAGVGGGLAAMAIGLEVMTPFITAMAPGILIVAFAMNLLAAAMTQFATISWEGIAKGLLGVGGGLTAMGFGMAFVGPAATAAAPGVLAISVAFIFLAQAMSTMGKLKWEQIAKGLVAIGGALIAIGIGMHAMPLTLLPTAAGLLVVALALQGVALAVAEFGNMDLGTIVKGIAALGAVLLVLAIGLNAMIATLPGSVALLAAAAAFAVLVPAIALLGSLPVIVIVKGLIAIAAALGVLAGVGLIAAGPLAALGAALVPLGAAMVLIAGSVYIFAAALRLLSIVGTKGLVALGAVIVGLVALIPKLIKDFLLGMVSVLEAIVKLLPKIVVAVGLIIDSLLQIIIESAPKLAIAAGSLILAFLEVLNENAQPMIDAGWRLIQALLKGVEDNLPKASASFHRITISFLEQMAKDVPSTIAAGTRVLVNFLGGIASNLPKVVASAAKVVVTFLTEVEKRMPQIVAKGAKLIVTFLSSIAQRLPRVIAAGVNVIVKFIDGIGNALPRIIAAGVRVVTKFINGIADAIPKLVDAGFKAVIRLLNGIAKAIRENDDQLRAAGYNVASAIIEGMLGGFKDLWHKVEDLAESLSHHLPKIFRKALGIASPSKVFTEIGQQTMAGLVVGISDGGDKAVAETDDVANRVINAFGHVPGQLDGLIDLDPTITPVLDLSQVEAGAKKLGDLTTTAPVVATLSSDQANGISNDTLAAQAAALAAAEAASQQVPSVTFNQTNTSPESLSDTEIYRQTKNQLSQLKKVLGVPTILPSAG